MIALALLSFLVAQDPPELPDSVQAALTKKLPDSKLTCAIEPCLVHIDLTKPDKKELAFLVLDKTRHRSLFVSLQKGGVQEVVWEGDGPSLTPPAPDAPFLESWKVVPHGSPDFKRLPETAKAAKGDVLWLQWTEKAGIGLVFYDGHRVKLVWSHDYPEGSE